MNIFLQIGIGLIPGTAVALLLLFKRKAFNIGKILLNLFLVAVCAGGIYLGACKPFEFSPMKNEIKETKLSAKELLSLANGLTLKGAYDEAKEILSVYIKKEGYDDESRLLSARIDMATGNYDAAFGIYQFLSINSDLVKNDDDEYKAIEVLGENLPAQIASMEYLESMGEDPKDYGYEASIEKLKKKTEKYDDDKIKKIVKNAIEEDYEISEQIEDISEAIAGVSVKNTDNEEGKQDKAYRVFDRIAEEYPEYLSLDTVSKAKIEADVKAGKYDEIAQNLSEASSYHELMVAAELYMNDIIRSNDFPETFNNLGIIDQEVVENQIELVYENLSQDLGKTERKQLKQRVEAVSKNFDEPELMSVKELLNNKIQNDSVSEDSKIYLEIAKIEDYLENEATSNGYISEALYTAGDSRDGAYADAMNNVVNIIQNKEDSEAVKQISEFVQKAMENSMTVDVSSVVPVNEEFKQNVVDYSNMLKAAVSIGYINSDGFPNMLAKVQLTSGYSPDMTKLKEILKVSDCGIEISEFELNKVDYDETDVILVCDVSGSMSGNIGQLQDAVKTFVEDMGENEKIGVISFDSAVLDTRPLGSSREELISFADSLSSRGGTAMYDATLNAISMFEDNPKHNNVIILMSDGQDNDSHKVEEINSELGAAAIDKGITIYTLGLGSEIDTEYLSTIASCANGSFLYVEQADSLKRFYENLHAQVNNQYEIKYVASDTVKLLNRSLEISIPDENKSDTKYYNLKAGESVSTSKDLTLGFGKTVSGLTPGMIYQTKQEVAVKIKGEGFTQSDKIKVRLKGITDYSMPAEYIDAQTLEFKVPGNISADKYDVFVTLDNQTITLKNGFIVEKTGNLQSIKFGEYVFTASNISKTGDTYELSGNVTMNEWLRFNQNLTINGDLEGTSIKVKDTAGSKVFLNKCTDSDSFAYSMALKNIPVSVPALGEFVLYNDWHSGDSSDDFTVDDIRTVSLKVDKLIMFDAPCINVYPSNLMVKYETGTTLFPFQESLITACGGDKDNLFMFSYSGKMAVTNENIGLIMNIEAESGDNFGQKTINFFNEPVKLNGDIRASIDTGANEYSLGGKLKFSMLSDKSAGIGADVSWKSGLVDKVKLNVDVPVEIEGVVPTKLSDFWGEAANISDAVSSHKYGAIELSGGLTAELVSVSAISPKMAKYLGDICLVQIPDATVTCSFDPFKLTAEADALLFEQIKLLSIRAGIGNVDYYNELLNIAGPVRGGFINVTQGITYDNDDDSHFKFNLAGTSEVDFHNRFAGIYSSGELSYDISWWIFDKETKYNGDAAFGLYTTEDGKLQLIYKSKYVNDKGKIDGDYKYIDEDHWWKLF